MFDDARLSDVFVGIDRTVEEVLKRVKPAFSLVTTSANASGANPAIVVARSDRPLTSPGV